MPAPTKAQEFESLFENFSASNLKPSEKRFLQTALAFEGHYVGLLDGAWGKLSQEALESYSWATFETSSANWHMAMLAHSFFDFVERDGWDYYYIEPAQISVLWPFASIIRDEPSDGFVNYRHGNSSLGISLAIQDTDTAQQTHNYVQNRHELDSAPYEVRRSDVAITTSKRRDGSMLYTRSNFIDGAWSTILLSAGKNDEALLTTMAASIKRGRAETLRVSTGGQLEQVIFKTARLLEEAEKDESERRRVVAAPRTTEEQAKLGKTGSGSGFYVSTAGTVMTNAHVVDGCGAIFVDNAPATISAKSSDFDLALLEVDATSPKAVAVFSASSAGLNADVVAVGFPYSGLLGGLNITRGSVSSMKGLTGDLTRMQISAPIQPGNSGGPVLGSDGEVIGVVVSKLDALKVADVMGDIPQNVNFAVRGEIAKLFMSQNGIKPLLSLEDTKLEPEALAERAEKFTVFVECR